MEHRSLAPDFVVSDDDDASGNQFPEKSAPDVAQKELRQEEQMGGPVNCSDSELCTFLAALAAGFLPTYYSDTSQSVQSKSTPIASKSWRHGKKTVVFPGFPFLQMSRNSTESLGAELLTWFLAASHARTFQPLEKAQVSKEIDPASGGRWRELSVRYDRNTCSWKTHRSLWDEDLSACSLTLPKWGSMRDGVLWEQDTSAAGIFGNAAGSWLPTLGKNEFKGAGKDRYRGSAAYRGAKMSEGLRTCKEDPIYLTPLFGEYVMGWPLTWTELAPLETAKYQQWQQQHGCF